jgi:hypothetical protein
VRFCGDRTVGRPTSLKSLALRPAELSFFWDRFWVVGIGERRLCVWMSFKLLTKIIIIARSERMNMTDS